MLRSSEMGFLWRAVPFNHFNYFRIVVCVDSLLTWRSPHTSRQLLLALVVVFLLSCFMSGVAFFQLAGNYRSKWHPCYFQFTSNVIDCFSRCTKRLAYCFKRLFWLFHTICLTLGWSMYNVVRLICALFKFQNVIFLLLRICLLFFIVKYWMLIWSKQVCISVFRKMGLWTKIKQMCASYQNNSSRIVFYAWH